MGDALSADSRDALLADRRDALALVCLPAAVAASFLVFGPSGLAPATRTLLSLVAVPALLAAGVAAHRGWVSAVPYSLASLAYVALVWRAVSEHGLAELGGVLLIGAAPLAIGLAVALPPGTLLPSRRTRYVAVGLLLLAGVAAVGYDVGTEVSYDATLVNETTVTVPDGSWTDRAELGRETQIGTVTVTNDAPFRRSTQLPTFEGCVAGDHADVVAYVTVFQYVPISILDDEIEGREEVRTGITARFGLRGEPGDAVTVAVERGPDCDVDREELTLIVSET